MTQAGRQSSPRNGSGRNSSGRNEAKGGAGRSNAGGFSGRGGSAGAGRRNFTQGEGRPFKASKPREAAPFDPDNPTTAQVSRSSSINETDVGSCQELLMDSRYPVADMGATASVTGRRAQHCARRGADK